MSGNPLFDASYERLFGDSVSPGPESDAFFSEFYDRFLEAPEIAALFRNTDMDRQVGMLRRSFFQLAAFYVSCQPSGELERLAQVHHALGIDGSHFDRWLDALVATVRSRDPCCDQATELAWRWALTPGITYLKLFGNLSPRG